MARNDSRQQYPDQGVIVVSQSGPQMRVLFGFLFVVSAVALARGVTGAATEAGRVAIAVIFGALTAGFLVGLVLATWRLDRLEVTEQAITYVRWSGQNKAVLSREWGDEIRFVRRYSGIWPVDGLTIEGTDKIITLPTFSRAEVQRACVARGWRFRSRRLRTLDPRPDPVRLRRPFRAKDRVVKSRAERPAVRHAAPGRVRPQRAQQCGPATGASASRHERASRPGFTAHLRPT